MIAKLLEGIVSAVALARGNILFNVTFIKDFGPWKANQNVDQLTLEDGCVVESNIKGEEVQRVRVALSPVVAKTLTVTGRHTHRCRAEPDFVASLNGNVLRIDDQNHPDFWLQVYID